MRAEKNNVCTRMNVPISVLLQSQVGSNQAEWCDIIQERTVLNLRL
jgi:hypothetical protein